MKTCFFFLLFFVSINTFAQLGFCTGSKGDPIFHEDFGSGSGTGPALDNGVTNYTYVTQDPQDGQYTISDQYFGADYFLASTICRKLLFPMAGLLSLMPITRQDDFFRRRSRDYAKVLPMNFRLF